MMKDLSYYPPAKWRWTNVGNYLYDVEPTLKKGWKCKLDWRNFSDVETTLILRCESHQPKLNVKPTLKQRRNFKSNRRTLYRRCFDVWMLLLNQHSQNDVRITLISRCRRCQPNFNAGPLGMKCVVCPLGMKCVVPHTGKLLYIDPIILLFPQKILLPSSRKKLSDK